MPTDTRIASDYTSYLRTRVLLNEQQNIPAGTKIYATYKAMPTLRIPLLRSVLKYSTMNRFVVN